MNICVTSCPQLRLNITGKGRKVRLRRSPLLVRPLYLTATDPLGSWGIRRQDLGLVYCAPTKDPTTRRLRVTVSSATTFFARSQKFLNQSICHTVLRTVLESVPTIIPSRMDWENLYEVGLKLWNSTGSPKVNGINSWKISRSIAICSLALPRSPARAANSRRSGKKLPRSAVTIPVMSRTPIPHYLAIATEIYIDGLLDVRKWINWIT